MDGKRPSPRALLDHLEHVIVGKRDALTMILASMIADGHVLIEDVPGVAKTIAARTLARSFDLRFSRVQMTPDLLPGDIQRAHELAVFGERDAQRALAAAFLLDERFPDLPHQPVLRPG